MRSSHAVNSLGMATCVWVECATPGRRELSFYRTRPQGGSTRRRPRAAPPISGSDGGHAMMGFAPVCSKLAMGETALEILSRFFGSFRRQQFARLIIAEL